MIFENEASLINFVCIVFEQGVKMLTLSSIENLIRMQPYVRFVKQCFRHVNDNVDISLKIL